MISINGFKGIWTLDEVIKLLQDSNVKFKIVLENGKNFNHEVENNFSSDKLNAK